MWSSLLLASTVAFFTLLLDKTVDTKPLFGFLHPILLGVLLSVFITATAYCTVRIIGTYFLMNYMLEELKLDKLHEELIRKYDAFSFSRRYTYFKNKEIHISFISFVAVYSLYTLFVASVFGVIETLVTIVANIVGGLIIVEFTKPFKR